MPAWRSQQTARLEERPPFQHCEKEENEMHSKWGSTQSQVRQSQVTTIPSTNQEFTHSVLFGHLCHILPGCYQTAPRSVARSKTSGCEWAAHKELQETDPNIWLLEKQLSSERERQTCQLNGFLWQHKPWLLTSHLLNHRLPTRYSCIPKQVLHKQQSQDSRGSSSGKKPWCFPRVEAVEQADRAAPHRAAASAPSLSAQEVFTHTLSCFLPPAYLTLPPATSWRMPTG